MRTISFKSCRFSLRRFCRNRSRVIWSHHLLTGKCFPFHGYDAYDAILHLRNRDDEGNSLELPFYQLGQHQWKWWWREGNYRKRKLL